jgi:hypothetical protein
MTPHKLEAGYELNGVLYESMIQLVGVGCFDFCGCVEDVATLRMIQLLRLIPLPYESGEGIEKMCADLGESEAIVYIMLSYLDKLGMIEHGISIRHPWLTDKGLECLRACEQITETP